MSGAADDDPSALLTYAAAGARTGFGLLWTCTVALPLMVALQVCADRIAMTTGHNVGTVARRRFGRIGGRLFAALLVVHLAANVLVIAADLTAIGSAITLVGPGPSWPWSLGAGAAITVLLTSGSFDAIAGVLKVLCVVLLSYVAVLAVADVPWADVGERLVRPTWPAAGDRGILLAVLGATLPPYVFLWQGTHRLEELRQEGDSDRAEPARPGSATARRRRRSGLVDVTAGMTLAVVVMFAVIVATAVAADGERGDIETVADAAGALEPIAGATARALLAVGIVAAGLLAVPILAGAASAPLASYVKRPWGFSRSPRQAPGFYAMVAVGTLGGTVLTLSGVEPVRLLVLAATVNGITAAPLLAVLMRLASDGRVMGGQRPGVVPLVLGWSAVALMGCVSLAALLT